MEYFSIAVVALMAVFAVLGIIDMTFLKNKFGLGPEFKRGIELIGPLVIALAGIISLVPLIAFAINNTLTPLYKMMGLDPSMAVSTILATDMGAFHISKEIALDPTVGNWASIVYGSMMGATIVFSIPVGLGTITKKDVSSFSKGILFGVAAIPFGTFVAGLMMGIPILTILINLIPPVIFSIIIILCLALWPKVTMKVFQVFSLIVTIISMCGFALAIVKDNILTPIANTGAFDIENVPFFNLINPLSDGIATAGAIGIILAGALPFILCLNKVLKKPLAKLSKKIGFSSEGMSGFLLTCANDMAMFAILPKMREREKIINTAFAVCAAFVIGDILAFTAANAPECIAPMMVGKIISGIIAVVIAVLFTRKMKPEPILAAEGASIKQADEPIKVEQPAKENKEEKKTEQAAKQS